MNRLSKPVFAVSVTVVVAAVAAILGYAVLNWAIAHDWALVGSSFGAVQDSSDPFAVSATTANGNVAATRDALLKMLQEMLAGAVVVMAVMPLVWIGWYSLTTFNGFKDGKKGLGLWWGLFLATAVMGAVIAYHAVFRTAAGASLSSDGNWIVAAVLVGLPIAVFTLVTYLTTPNAARMSLPF